MNQKTIITPMMYAMLPWIASVAFFMQTLDTSILNTALPQMADDLHESPINMQSAIISYALTLALFIPVSGFLADKFGARNVFILALILFASGSLCCALSTDLMTLDLFRIVQGIGGAMMVPVSRLVLLKTFERDRFLDAINTSTLLGLVGPFLGPLLGGYLVEHASWHWIFLINVPIGIIGVILSYFFMPNIKETNSKFDLFGVFLISFAFILTTLSFESLNDESSYFLPAALFFIAVILFTIYFYYAKKKKDNAIFPLSLFKIRTFNLGIWGNLICRIGSQSIPFLMPLCLQLAYDYSPLESGLMLVPIAAGAIVMKKFVSPILSIFNYKTTLLWSTVITGILIFLLGFVPIREYPLVLCILLFLMGLANSLRFTCMSTITLADINSNNASSANTMLSVTQQLAITFGVTFGALLVRFLEDDNTVILTNLENAFKTSFFILGVVTILPAFIFIKLNPEDGENLIRKKRGKRAMKP